MLLPDFIRVMLPQIQQDLRLRPLQIAVQKSIELVLPFRVTGTTPHALYCKVSRSGLWRPELWRRIWMTPPVQYDKWDCTNHRGLTLSLAANRVFKSGSIWKLGILLESPSQVASFDPVVSPQVAQIECRLFMQVGTHVVEHRLTNHPRRSGTEKRGGWWLERGRPLNAHLLHHRGVDPRIEAEATRAAQAPRGAVHATTDDNKREG